MCQPLDFRDEAIFHDLEVVKRKSAIHGTGVFSPDGHAKGAVVLRVLIPGKAVKKGFASASGGYDPYQHIMHRDGLGVMLIDLGVRMRGNFGACREDYRTGVLRMLNHSKTPNVGVCPATAAEPGWYEPVGEKYTEWYECSLVALREVQAGEELVIRYAVPPKGAK